MISLSVILVRQITKAITSSHKPTNHSQLIMSTACMKKFQKALQNEIEQVVHALAGHYKFDAEEAVKFIKSGTKTRKVVEKRSKLSPEAKVARELAKAAIAKAKQQDREAKKVEALKAKEARKAAKLAEKEAAKAAKLAEKEAAKAAKLAEKAKAKAAKDAEKAKAKAAKDAEKAKVKAAKDAEKAKVKAAKDAEKAAAKEAKAVAKLTAQLAKLFDLEELDDDLKQTVAGKDSAALKDLIVAEKAGLKAEKKRATQIRKLAEKRAALIAEIHDLAKRCGGGINFSENEIENADMDGLKEIRKTIKKCLRKIERAERVAAVKDQQRVDNAKFAGQTGDLSILKQLPIC